MHRLTVHAVTLQPGPVLREILPRGSDQDRLLSEVGHPERDVGGNSPAMYLKVLDQEGQGDLVQLVDNQGVGKAPLVGHEVVSGNGSGEGYTHPGNLPRGGGRDFHNPVETIGSQAEMAPLLLVSVTRWYPFPWFHDRNTVTS